MKYYLSSTFAPAASSFSLISLASSLGTSSLISLGADSTSSFASFKPSPVAVLTSLITLIFLSPTSERTIVNESFSSSDSPPESPPGEAAATATGAAAETPHFYSKIFVNSEASRTVKFDSSSAIFSKSAIFFS